MVALSEKWSNNLLRGKTALITGATGGLGRSLSIGFMEAGADLILLGRNLRALKALKDGLSHNTECNMHIIESDLSDIKGLLKAVSGLPDACGIPNILVNNAAIQGPIGPSWENDLEHWEETVRVNLLAPVALCRFFVPEMLKTGGGRIINISGGGAAGPRPNFTAYACSKTALVRYSETLADELRDSGITVNCIAPGPLKTKMTEEIVSAGLEHAGKDEYTKACSMISGDDENASFRAADLAVYLSSDLCSGITGRLISAVWDHWETLPEHADEIASGDIYTLRRITPGDRGEGWGSA